MQPFRLRPVSGFVLVLFTIVGLTPAAQQSANSSEVVEYASGSLRLRGVLFRPSGAGPHPAVVFLHGANGASDSTVTTIGRTFASQGYLLFFPFRRGLGPSQSSGEAILARLAREGEARGAVARLRLMAELLETEQLDDALGALDYVRRRADVDSSRLAVYGHSFGGILSLFVAERESGIRAVVSAAPAAQNWAGSEDIRNALRRAARSARVPIFFFQAANDYDLTPTEQLALEMSQAGKSPKRKIYPAWGTSVGEGHNFAYLAPQVWGPDVFGFLSKHLRTR